MSTSSKKTSLLACLGLLGASILYGCSGFEVFTGRTTVVILGTRGSYVRTAARELRDVRQAQRPALLPPPAPGSLRGDLPCRGKPG